MPDLSTLVPDIYNLFDPENDHECSEENLDAFANNLKSIVRDRLRVYKAPDSPLRFSSLGKPDRQIWFDAHPVEEGKEKLLPKTYLKFLYGDVIEQVLLFLVKEAGHSVEMEQHEVEIDGVRGHIDALVDGVLVDVKSASPYGYKKFEDRRVTEDDPFGYVDQLAGYSNILTPDRDAAWLAMDKVGGDLCVSPLPSMVIKHHQPEDRISHLKQVIEQEEPPSLCHQPVPDGKSGNMKLPTPCGYCSWKWRCHPSLRGFAYSNGPRYLTTVAKTPDVPEFGRANAG